MSDSLNKYCSEAKDFKDVKDAMNKIQKLRAQMKNPTRDGMIEALRDPPVNKKCPVTFHHRAVIGMREEGKAATLRYL